MTPQISQAADRHIESELDRLTFSAYLLTLDPGVAVSVVMTAIDESHEEIITGPDLLERAVELALEQLRRESRTEGDAESSPFDAVLYGHSAAINSPTFQSLKDLSSKQITIQTDDDQIITIHRSRKTKFLKGTQTIKPSDIDIETPVTVDASEDVDLSLTAVSVTVDTPKKSSDGSK